MNTVIIGGGFAGLSVANALKGMGIPPDKITIIEAANKLGGLIDTTQEKGYTIESGPEGYRGNSIGIQKLIKYANLEKEVIPSTKEASSIRYIVKKGKLKKLPSGPLSAITTTVFSPKTKFRILLEPFIKPKNIPEESIASFVSRRFGKGLDPLIDAFVSGVYAGDHQQLVIDYVFPELKQMEQQHGSVIKGGIAMMKQLKKAKKQQKQKLKEKNQKSNKKEKPPYLLTFPRGLKQSIQAMAKNTNILLNQRVTKIEKENNKYLITTDQKTIEAENIVIAVSPNALTNIEVFGEKPKNKTREAKVAIVSLAYDEKQFKKPPKGYGFLSPSKEERFVLGILFSSQIFPHKAPNGKTLLRCFIGGIRYPERAEMENDKLIQNSKEEIKDLLKVQGEPEYVHVQKHYRGISQLEKGHNKIIQYKKQLEAENPGLYFTGLGWTGISTDHLSREALKIAEKVILRK